MKKILLLVSAVASLCLTSCDINDVRNVRELSTDNFPAKAEDADAVLAGIYMGLNSAAAAPQTTFLYYAQLASDDALGGGGTNDKLMQAMDLICNYNQNMTNDFYVARYSSINRANTLIQAVPNLPLSDVEKATMLGEAKFMRAFFYYELASMYGNVPLRTVPSGDSQPVGSISELWGQILQDLYEASTTMPAVRKSDGHVDKYTAQAMLGRAWLFYTGMYGNGETLADLTSTTYNPLTSVTLPNGTTLTKQMVIDEIDDCVNNSGYSLVPDFRNLWAYTNRCTVEDADYTKGKGLKWVEDDLNGAASTNPESMFAIKFNKLASWSTTIGYSNQYALHFGMRGGQSYADTFPFGQGWGAGPVTSNLVTDWQDAKATLNNNKEDIRLEATIQDVNKLPNHAKGAAGWADFVQETDYYAKKWSPIAAKNDGSLPSDVDYTGNFENIMYGKDGGVSGGYGLNMQLDNIHDLVLIRFADVLLMQSELKENVSGINQVRARAGLDPIAGYTLKALQDERRWELALEGIRWNDIRRWHIAAAALDKQLNTKVYTSGNLDRNTAHNGGYSARYNATAGFQKMPENQLKYGIPQNAGWTDASSEYQGW